MSKRVGVRMPERASPDALQAFVDQGKENVPAPAKTQPRTNGEGPTVRLNLNMPQELHRAFKLACVAQDVTISEVVTRLVQEWTDKQR